MEQLRPPRPDETDGAMSTDLHERTANPSPDPSEPEKPKAALSFAQVAGGALAAMTAAALGSRLSVAGTVVGAALASVIAAVAGSVYTTSLRRTHDRVSAVWKGRGRVDVAPPPGPGVDDAAAAASEPVTPVTSTSVGSTAAGRRRIGWKPILAGALLMFAVAAVALTGIELATGHALSGGSGTTVGQVADGGTTPSSRPTQQATPTPTPTTSTSSKPTATPSATPTSGPTTDPTPSPTAEPSASASPSGSATPDASAPAVGGVGSS